MGGTRKGGGVSISFQIVGHGTPRDPSSPLCASCKHAMVMRDSLGESSFRCQVLGVGKVLSRKIVECTAFYPGNEPWLSDYESLAWVWSSGANGEPAFIRLRDLEVGTMQLRPAMGFGR
jgi:hypothetical protein